MCSKDSDVCSITTLDGEVFSCNNVQLGSACLAYNGIACDMILLISYKGHMIVVTLLWKAVQICRKVAIKFVYKF